MMLGGIGAIIVTPKDVLPVVDIPVVVVVWTYTGLSADYSISVTVDPGNSSVLYAVTASEVFRTSNGGDQWNATGVAPGNSALLAIDPRHLQAMKARAALRRAQGKLDDAIAAAEAVIAENPGEPWAYKEIGLDAPERGRNHTVPLVVRLEGTNVELGRKILNESGLAIQAASSMADGAQKVVAAVGGAK